MRSDPPGAEVWLDGALAGTTPLRLMVESARGHIIEVRPGRGAPQVYRVEPRIEPTYIVLDIITAGVGLVVDAVSGGWYESSVTRVESAGVPSAAGAEPAQVPPPATGPEPPTGAMPHPGGPLGEPVTAPAGYGP